MHTVDQIIAPYLIQNSEGGAVDWQQLRGQLVEREDEIKVQLHRAGEQFGLYPEIVAEVLASIGVGTIPTPEERQIIRHNFIELMRRLQSEQ